MNDELFADLLASAKEMVEIENGECVPEPDRIHFFVPDGTSRSEEGRDVILPDS